MTHSRAVQPFSFKSRLWVPPYLVLAVAIACGLAGSTAATASEADPDQQLVDSVPAEAAVVLIVKSGEELRDDVYAFIRNAGIERDSVDWDAINPLGLSEQFEGRRGLVFFRRPPAAGELGEGRERGKWAGLIPVAHAQQALENLNAESTGNGLYAFSVKRRDVPDPLLDDDADEDNADEHDVVEDDAAAGTRGDQNQQARRQDGQAAGQADRVRLVAAVAQPDLLAIARDSEALRWFLANREGPGLFSTWQVDQRQLFAQSDLFFSLNVQTFRPALVAKLEQKMAETQPQNSDAAANPPDVAQMSRLAQSVFEQFKAVVEQTDSVYAGAMIQPESIRGTLQIAFEPTSELYEELAVRPDSRDLLKGLPDRSFMIATALNAKPFQPLIGQLAEQLGDLALAFAPQNQQTREQIEKQVDAIKRMERVEGLLDFTDEGPIVLERTYFDDAQAVFEQVVTGLDGNDALTGMFLPKSMKLVQRETTVDGVKVVEFALEQTEPADIEQREQDADDHGTSGVAFVAQLLKKVTIQAAVVDNSIVEAIGPQDNPIRLVLGQDGQSLRSREGVQATFEALPDEELFGVLLINPARIAQALSEQMARVFTQGEQQEQQLQRIRQRFAAVEPGPPIGFAASTDGPGLTFSAIVLAESVKPLTSLRSSNADRDNAEPPQPHSRPATRK